MEQRKFEARVCELGNNLTGQYRDHVKGLLQFGSESFFKKLSDEDCELEYLNVDLQLASIRLELHELANELKDLTILSNSTNDSVDVDRYKCKLVICYKTIALKKYDAKILEQELIDIRNYELFIKEIDKLANA